MLCAAAPVRELRTDPLSLPPLRVIKRIAISPEQGTIRLPRPESTGLLPQLVRRRQNNVAVLRSAAARNPYDKHLSDLSTQSDEFRSLWADHDVLTHQAGTTRMTHPTVGTIELFYEALELTADHGMTLIA
jgi:hypothetical protein